MKKFSAIFFCATLLFNWVGYRLFISYLQKKVNIELEGQLDNNNYDASQLISIKIPANHLSSYSNSGKFERVDGEVEIKGLQYRLVKKRLFNDSLEYMCVADCKTMQLRSAKNELFSLVNDLKHCSQQKKSHTGPSKNVSSEYLPLVSYFIIKNSNTDDFKKSFHTSSLLPQTIFQGIEKPPQLY